MLSSGHKFGGMRGGAHMHLLNDRLRGAGLAADQLTDHLDGALDRVGAARDVDAAGLALGIVLIHHDMGLAGLLQGADGLAAAADDAAHNPLRTFHRLGGAACARVVHGHNLLHLLPSGLHGLLAVALDGHLLRLAGSLVVDLHPRACAVLQLLDGLATLADQLAHHGGRDVDDVEKLAGSSHAAGHAARHAAVRRVSQDWIASWRAVRETTWSVRELASLQP
jgi:hypothetical protein